MATSSLVPSATNSWYVDAPLEQLLAPGRAPVGMHVVDELGADRQRAFARRESKSPMMMSGFSPISSSASAPPSTPMSTGRYSRM